MLLATAVDRTASTGLSGQRATTPARPANATAARTRPARSASGPASSAQTASVAARTRWRPTAEHAGGSPGARPGPHSPVARSEGSSRRPPSTPGGQPARNPATGGDASSTSTYALSSRTFWSVDRNGAGVEPNRSSSRSTNNSVVVVERWQSQFRELAGTQRMVTSLFRAWQSARRMGAIGDAESAIRRMWRGVTGEKHPIGGIGSAPTWFTTCVDPDMAPGPKTVASSDTPPRGDLTGRRSTAVPETGRLSFVWGTISGTVRTPTRGAA